MPTWSTISPGRLATGNDPRPSPLYLSLFYVLLARIDRPVGLPDPFGTDVCCRPDPLRSLVPAETHVEGAPIGRDEVLELIRDRLADILEIEPAQIAEGASFADDLDADSLALIELVEALEEELSERSAGFRIEDDDLEDLRTVRDAVDYVVARLG